MKKSATGTWRNISTKKMKANEGKILPKYIWKNYPPNNLWRETLNQTSFA